MESVLVAIAVPIACMAVAGTLLANTPALHPPATGTARQLLVQHQAAVAVALNDPTAAGVITPAVRWWQAPGSFTSCVDSGTVVTASPVAMDPPPAAVADALAGQVYHAAGYGLARAGTVRFRTTLPVIAIPTGCPVPDGAAVAVTRVR